MPEEGPQRTEWVIECLVAWYIAERYDAFFLQALRHAYRPDLTEQQVSDSVVELCRLSVGAARFDDPDLDSDNRHAEWDAYAGFLFGFARPNEMETHHEV